MAAPVAWWQKLQFFCNAAALYILTAVVISGLAAADVWQSQPQLVAVTRTSPTAWMPVAPKIKIVSGRPVRIVIPSRSVDLPLDKGTYDSRTDAWTLSGYHAQFAVFSSPANNVAGDTFIYGHNNNYVFGALRHQTPARGATALVYTANGHIFAYRFVSVKSVGPDDVSALTYSGPPVMTIQTCTGSLNEWRTMYRFDFSKVVR